MQKTGLYKTYGSYKPVSVAFFLIQQFPKSRLRLLLLSAILNITACTTPSANFHNTAIEHQFKATKINTSLFEHIIYHNNISDISAPQRLHIYLDGDGTPWLRHRWIAKDPSPRNPQILELMSLDKSPAILLGRPCYYGLHTTSNCHYRYWTSHRYAPDIVESMAQALSTWLAQHPQFKQLSFIGYSGGGTLAVLLAPYFSNTQQVVTVAANLDIDAWSNLHNYSPLSGSLNPINQPKLSPATKQLHISGSQDKNVPSVIIKSYVIQQESATLLVFENQVHCCWNKHWQSILDTIGSNNPHKDLP